MPGTREKRAIQPYDAAAVLSPSMRADTVQQALAPCCTPVLASGTMLGWQQPLYSSRAKSLPGRPQDGVKHIVVQDVGVLTLSLMPRNVATSFSLDAVGNIIEEPPAQKAC